MSKRSHAIVLGASMTGLGAARALANHFQRVTIVERDVLHDEPVGPSRKGVAQGNHGHALLASGYRILEGYFPGLMDELVASGASRGDATGDFLIYQFGAWKLRKDCGITGIVVSRPLLETTVRTRTRRLPNVAFLENHDVLEPTYDASLGAVTGVRVKNRGSDASGQTRDLDADLVVDCTGRGSISPRWLAAWGYEDVAESHVKCEVGYASAQFERKPGDCHDATAALIIGSPPSSKRGGGLFGIEGNRWLVTLGCWLGDYPPTDLAGFREYARSIPSSEIYDIVKDREPLTPILPYRFPSSRHRHYEKLTRFPHGYLVMGDAVCSFNPLYGQGMSVAMMEAKALDERLAREPELNARRFFRDVAKVVESPWSIAVGEDLRFPEVEGKRPPGFALISRYMQLVHAASRKDPVVLRRFVEVAGLLAEPTAILAPAIALRVLAGGFGKAQSSPARKA